MKLVLAMIGNNDANNVVPELLKEGYAVTTLSTTATRHSMMLSRRNPRDTRTTTLNSYRCSPSATKRHRDWVRAITIVPLKRPRKP